MVDEIIGILIEIVAGMTNWDFAYERYNKLWGPPALGGHFYAEVELNQHSPPAQYAAFVVIKGMRRCIVPENVKAVDWETGFAVEFVIEDVGDGEDRRWAIRPARQSPQMRAAIDIDFINKCGVA